MKEGIQKCPKCKGQGKIRYRVWDSHSIIGYLIAYKKGEPVSEASLVLRLLKMDHLRISCSQKGQNGESSIKTEWTSGISYGYRV